MCGQFVLIYYGQVKCIDDVVDVERRIGNGGTVYDKILFAVQMRFAQEFCTGHVEICANLYGNLGVLLHKNAFCVLF